MSCAWCGHDVSRIDGETDVFAADGSVWALPAAFCPACGWPLARPQVNLWPGETVQVSDRRPGEVQVVITNDGDGALYYSLTPDELLRPASLPMLHGQVLPGARRDVGFRVVVEKLAGPRATAAIDVQLLAATPPVMGAARTVPVESLWVGQRLEVTIESLRAGPVDADSRHLLFGLGTDELYLNVLNYGGARIEAEVECTQGFTVCGDVGAGFAEKAVVALRPGRPQDTDHPRPGVTTLRLRAPRAGRVPPGQAMLRCPGLPPLLISLEKVVPAPPPLPERRYTVGIDFGTSKTAVAWVDRLALPPEPKVVEWPRPDPGSDPRWLPSAVFYDRQYGQASFGDEALGRSGASVTEVGVRLDGHGRYANELGTLFVGMKMFLRDEPAGDGPSLHQVAVDFFRHLFGAVTERTEVDLAGATVVLSLPVLSEPESYRQQEELMRRAAVQAGELFGVRAEQLSFEKEPVCAAIDLVRLQAGADAAGPALQHDDWLCVFDSGAGTTDISLMQVVQQGGEWRFAQIEPIGYEWGGDDLDELLYNWLLGFWCSPEDPANIPASGPVAIRPVHDPRQPAGPKVIDADAPPARAVEQPLDWFSYMRDQAEFLFAGASQPVTRSELLGLVSRFKEKWLNVNRDDEPEGLTSETPLRALSPARRGERGPWTPLRLGDVANLVSLEFLEMHDQHEQPLRVRFPALCRQLGMLKPRLVCPVGGTSLVRGWREAVRREPLGLSGILEGPAELRRLHVARGAAQKELFRVEDRLPQPARLQVAEYTPGAEPAVLDEAVLAAGTPPGERQEVKLLATLPLQPERRLALRVLLGDRLLRQALVPWYDGADVLAERGLAHQAAVRLQAALSYLRQPSRLSLTAHWLVPGEPDAVERGEVRLPRFEE